MPATSLLLQDFQEEDQSAAGHRVSKLHRARQLQPFDTLPATASTATTLLPPKTPPRSKDEQDPAKDALPHRRISARALPGTKRDKFGLVSENLQASEIALGKRYYR